MPEISNKLIIVEPHIDAKITYDILSQEDFDKIKLVKSEDPSGENVMSVKSLYHTSTTIDLTSSDCTDFMMKKLGVQKLADITNLYVRWTLCKKMVHLSKVRLVIIVLCYNKKKYIGQAF